MNAFPSERPTKPIENHPSNTLVFAKRIDRLATLARERLLCEPDADAIVAAVENLDAIRALAGQVMT